MKTHLLKLTPAEFCAATGACKEGLAFATTHATMADVWANCQRVDWLVWILDAIEAPNDEKAYRLHMVWCARNTPLADGRTTGALITDPRSIAALEMAERFANGAVTEEEWSAARSALGSAAWSAARSAAAESTAAESAAWSAAWSATWSAAAALSAARSAAWSTARSSAWSDAQSAAAAAESAQANQFRKVVANPFL